MIFFRLPLNIRVSHESWIKLQPLCYKHGEHCEDKKAKTKQGLIFNSIQIDQPCDTKILLKKTVSVSILQMFFK